MSKKRKCPGCPGEMSARATLCRDCRKRAITAGVSAVAARGTDGPAEAPANEKKQSPGQIAAFWGKARELAEFEQQDKQELHDQLIEHARERVDRPVTSLTHLTFAETSGLLDEMQARIKAHKLAARGPTESTSPPAPVGSVSW